MIHPSKFYIMGLASMLSWFSFSRSSFLLRSSLLIRSSSLPRASSLFRLSLFLRSSSIFRLSSFFDCLEHWICLYFKDCFIFRIIPPPSSPPLPPLYKYFLACFTRISLLTCKTNHRVPHGKIFTSNPVLVGVNQAIISLIIWTKTS